MSARRDDELTITLSRREWVKICAALVMRTDVDPKAQPLIEKLHPIVIEPLIEADVENRRDSDGR